MVVTEINNKSQADAEAVESIEKEKSNEEDDENECGLDCNKIREPIWKKFKNNVITLGTYDDKKAVIKEIQNEEIVRS